jgi:hypothetical protein
MKPIDSLARATVAFFAVDQANGAGHRGRVKILRERRPMPDLLLGGPVAHDALLTGAWSVGIIMVCYPLARRLYERDKQP